MDEKCVKTFGGPELLNSSFDAAEIVVLPLCYERAPSYGKGAETGPLHILEASAQLEFMDEEIFTDWSGLKIHTRPPLFPLGDPEESVREMEAAAAEAIQAGKFLLSLGGDHAISIGPIKAAFRRFPDIGVLQIDAHLDLRDEWNGSRYNHACVMRRVIGGLGLPAAQVGIRSVSKEEADYVRKNSLSPFYAHEIAESGDEWIQRAVQALPDTIYITIDLDGLDPSVIPGTGTPEPGGLAYRQLLKLLKAAGREKTVIAADINELVKIEGTQASEFTAAKIASKLFVYCSGRLKDG